MGQWPRCEEIDGLSFVTVSAYTHTHTHTHTHILAYTHVHMDHTFQIMISQELCFQNSQIRARGSTNMEMCAPSCNSRASLMLMCANKQVDRKKPPPPGGVPIYYVP